MTEAPKILKRFILIEKPIEEVWAAWTQADHLEQWLCDEASLDLRKGGAFDFRGPHVVRGGGGQVISELLPQELLAFSWRFGDCDTQVRLMFEPQLDMTRITVHHQNPGPISVWLLDDVWKYTFTLLKFYLEYGSIPGRIDFSKPPTRDITLSLSMPADQQSAFAAVTKADQLGAWMEVNATIDCRIGGVYENDWWQGCVITELEADRKITFTEKLSGSVSWIVEKQGGKTYLKVVHAGFDMQALDIENLFYGWSAYLITIAMFLKKHQPTVSWGRKLD